MSTLNDQIGKASSRVFRRAYIKRRNTDTGLFESAWYEITNDIKKWGKITTSVDAELYGKFKFPNAKLTVANDEGRYNPNDDFNSLWFGYAPQERTLVKIEAGYLDQTQTSGGIWINTQYPGDILWDDAFWGAGGVWDGDGTMFIGIISGDINLSDKNETTLNIKPLNEVFRQYAARHLNSWTSTGATSSEFMTRLRDQTDGAGGFIFRPFFGDTITNWDIATTSTNFSNLNTSGAADVRDKNCWEIIEKLAQAENYVAYVSNQGKFVFSSRDTSTGNIFNFAFAGPGLTLPASGTTIKSIQRYGKKYTKYYSSVQVKWAEADTSTSYEVAESGFTVTGGNAPWYYGERVYKLENTWIPNSATAQTLANNIFTNISNIKDEIEFTTSFISHLNILELCTISYDSSDITDNSLWDIYQWADTAGGAQTDIDLLWDGSGGDAIKLSSKEFRLLKVEVDLDKFESKFHARGS